MINVLLAWGIFVFAYTSVLADISLWEREVNESLRKNVIGNCVVRGAVDSSTTNSPVMREGKASDLIAHLFYPSKRSLDHMQQLPITLTLANQDLRDNAKRWNYTYEKWGSKNMLRPHIPIDHPGQDRRNCINMTLLAAQGHLVSYYMAFKQLKRGFYLLYGKQGFIHPSGAVGFSCGFYRGEEGCENRRQRNVRYWYKPCKHHLDSHDILWQNLFDPSLTNRTQSALSQACADRTSTGSPNMRDFNISRHKRVFIISSMWDYNYHHWVADSLARLAHHIDWLRARPDVMIHVRSYEDYDMQTKGYAEYQAAAKEMRARFFDLLGMDYKTRVISGPVLADEVFIPRCLRCGYLLSDPLEVQMLAMELLEGTRRRQGWHTPHRVHVGGRDYWPQAPLTSYASEVKGKYVIVQQRYTNDTRSSARKWINETARHVVRAFTRHFPTHQVILLNGLESLSLSEEIALYNQADVLVGAHGAGMTNMMFMPPNSLIVEFVGRLVDVNMPVCGYYGPMAAAFGHHHYIRSFDLMGLESLDTWPDKGARRAAEFYRMIHDGKDKLDIITVHDSVKVENQ
ncbi:glycosyltransferase family 61 protein [archaeon]|nr:MAG: glycosyltransferase family 61 protein [archaeon]